MFPNRKQWKSWKLLSKYGAIGFWLSILAAAIPLLMWLSPWVKGTLFEQSLFPSIHVVKQDGITINATIPSRITSTTIGNRVEHVIEIQNSTDYKFESIEFTIQYPELIEHAPTISGPPGFDYKVAYENMDWNVAISGSGSVSLPKVTKYGSFTLEGSALTKGQKITLILRSTPDPYPNLSLNGEIYYWISGEVSVAKDSLEKTQTFTAPLFYDSASREISVGNVHVTDPTSGRYGNLIRAY